MLRGVAWFVRCASVRGSLLCLSVCQGNILEGRVSKARWARKTKATRHDPKEPFLLDVPAVIFVNLDYLLNSCTDRNEKPPRLGQLVNQLLWDHRCSRPNVDAVVRASSSMACG
jgi:hypothetical protein